MQPRTTIVGKVTNAPIVAQSKANTQYLVLKLETTTNFFNPQGNQTIYVHNYEIIFGQKKFDEIQNNVRQGDTVLVEASLLSRKQPSNNGQEFINLSLSGITCEVIRPTMGQKLNTAMETAQKAFSSPNPAPSQDAPNYDEIPF